MSDIALWSNSPRVFRFMQMHEYLWRTLKIGDNPASLLRHLRAKTRVFIENFTISKLIKNAFISKNIESTFQSQKLHQ